MTNRKAFTLIEILFVIVMASIIFVVLLMTYTKMVEARVDIEAKQALIKDSYFAMEKINTLMKDYTIDYDEYFNRRILGCKIGGGVGDSFTWDTNADGFCDRFTTYGNNSYNSINSKIYSCSSSSTQANPEVINGGADLTNGKGCLSVSANNYQSYGQYKKMFWDVNGDRDQNGNLVGDDDDEDLGVGPVAVGDSINAKELYLISKDGKKRVYLRRQKIESYSGETLDINKLYNFKVLKLRGFDAGSSHNFSSAMGGLYDGAVDTWACDYQEGFVCNGNSIGSVYANYKMPNDVNDGWIEMFPRDLTVTDFNIQIFPIKDPKLAWNQNDVQINPYIKVYLKTKLYARPWEYKLNTDRLKSYELDLQSSFNIKTNY